MSERYLHNLARDARKGCVKAGAELSLTAGLSKSPLAEELVKDLDENPPDYSNSSETEKTGCRQLVGNIIYVLSHPFRVAELVGGLGGVKPENWSKESREALKRGRIPRGNHNG